MAILIAIAAIGLCAGGVSAAAIGMASLAIRREEKNLTLTGQATGMMTRVGRRVNGLYVSRPG